jgi:nitroimidazol reductase NimA-like FMN-containing flavoprotein (pyridoxamine 5'-phosphate oxidase superfamily)
MSGWMATSELEVLTLEACLDLLNTRRVGRLAVVVDGRPTIVPVNYAMDGETVVVRSGSGTKLAGSSPGFVAFEVDDIDEEAASGWDVVIEGRAEDITDSLDARSEELRATAVTPIAPGLKDHWLRIVPSTISGRRLVSG